MPNPGPLEPVEPDDLDERGDPVLGPGQAYATKGGQVFHPIRCEIVDQLLAQHKPVAVILRTTVGGRRECRVCVVQSSPEWNT